MKIGRWRALGAALALGVLAATSAHAGGKKDEVVIRIDVDGDEVSVTRNGLPVPPESILTEDGNLVIRGDDGETVLLAIPAGGDLQGNLHRPPTLPSRGLRIGVMLESPDPAVAAQAGVDPDEAILVTNVEDGGPADRGGLRRYDLITAVAGEAVGGIGDVRHALQEMEEGDHLALTVRRRGERVDLDIVPELRDLGLVHLSTDLEDGDLDELIQVMPLLDALDRTVYFTTGEDGDLAVIGKDMELEVERAREEADRAREEARREREEVRRAEREAVRAHEEAMREMEERLRELEERLEEVEEERQRGD